MDFMIQTQYQLYNNKILNYLNQALARMDIYKKSIKHLHKNKHFNFPKFYIIIYYREFIYWYKIVINYNTTHKKSKHKYIIKDYFPHTNKRHNFVKQITFHNNRQHKIITLEDYLLYYSKDTASQKIPKD